MQGSLLPQVTRKVYLLSPCYCVTTGDLYHEGLTGKVQSLCSSICFSKRRLHAYGIVS